MILKHARVTTIIPQPDGTALIEGRSYYEELSALTQEISQSIKTSKATLATDIIRCLTHITAGETKELNLLITTNPRTGEPNLIVKTWLIRKDNYRQ